MVHVEKGLELYSSLYLSIFFFSGNFVS